MPDLLFMLTITNRRMAESLPDYLREQGAALTLCSLAQGTADDAVLDMWGLADTERALLFSVVPAVREKALLRGLIRDQQLDLPGNGIAFTIPVQSVGGARTLHYLSGGQENEGCEEQMTASSYELIVAVANRGFVDLVMDAARGGGAHGGTVVHARGTGRDQAERFLGVSLASEKDVVLIVVRQAAKAAVMKAIMAEAGLSSKAGTVLFTLPVRQVAGMRGLENED